VSLSVLRGNKTLSIRVTAIEERHEFDGLSDVIQSSSVRVPQLGMLGIDVDGGEQDSRLLPDLRIPKGVYVAAWSDPSGKRPEELLIGDVIHRVNGSAVDSIDDLNRELRDVKSGAAVALWIERGHKLQYVAFEME
jgi:S1-C subfamily serine protease